MAAPPVCLNNLFLRLAGMEGLAKSSRFFPCGPNFLAILRLDLSGRCWKSVSPRCMHEHTVLTNIESPSNVLSKLLKSCLRCVE